MYFMYLYKNQKIQSNANKNTVLKGTTILNNFEILLPKRSV